MPIEDFDVVVQTHVLGTARSVKAVWNIMREAGYGRIVLTTSAAGLMGNFGQSNYAAAKLGIVGLAGSLRIEGEKSNIRVNVISPFAVTRMSEGLVPADVAEQMSPRHVSPAVAFLASEESPNGVILNAGKGRFSASRMVTSPGIELDLASLSAETIRDNWSRIIDPVGEAYYSSAHSFSRHAIMGQAEPSHAG
jgi:NAD(P)-dependent dehydrogenase (short-subunit alcohol dehydrogenase family)